MGLPLAVALANVNFEVVALDVSGPAVEAVNLGKTLFFEPNLEEFLERAIKKGFMASEELWSDTD